MKVDDILNMSAVERLPDMETIIESSNTILGWQKIEETTIKPLIDLQVTNAQLRSYLNTISQHRVKLGGAYSRNNNRLAPFLSRAINAKASSRAFMPIDDFFI